ncbi:Putative protein phosphatase 2C-type [Rubripirellula lacrimiformis]|uniref:PPM-type phosphatase domain-containing protein n=1 Tax=Rubripirellula lacrimiformis TaxID=1930273 RepID=A0A517NC02_9BACT|nr:protein phosphatase 2C domain-containing protein [Rubripirellula lacrimiformis]QDT04662.1 Putative protein phosphatase 2C-type [Rubripirellula lacrimiformis]
MVNERQQPVSDLWNPGIVFAQLTDVGMRRANNQDSLACLPAKTSERFWDRGHLFVVADGMGAHAAGELASKMATERIAMQFFRSPSLTTSEALRAAVIDANDEIHQRGQSNPEFHNMGTTASALVICPDGALVGHVGDSRVYRLRGGAFEQLTFDHSLVWEMEATGQTGQGIPRNVITRSLGPNAVVDVDVEGPFPVQAGDQFLLCSDGLTGLVEDNEIGVLLDCLPEDKAVRVLVDLANLRGGPDNTSVIVVKVVEPIGGNDTARKPKQRHPEPVVSRAILGTVAICVIGAILLAIMSVADPFDPDQPGDRNWIGPMVVAIMLGAITSAIAVFQWLTAGKRDPIRGNLKGAKGPYRRYDATPNRSLYEKLGDTVQALKDAANQNNWMMDWQKVDAHQQQGRESLGNKDIKAAIRSQSEAVIETMNQLREQNNRAANETSVDY